MCAGCSFAVERSPADVAVSAAQAVIARPTMSITTRSSNPGDSVKAVGCGLRTERGRTSTGGLSAIRSLLMITAPSRLIRGRTRAAPRRESEPRSGHVFERRAAWPCRASELPVSGQLGMGDTAVFLVPRWRDRARRGEERAAGTRVSATPYRRRACRRVRTLDGRCDVLVDQRAPELRLTAGELHAVRFERPPACARRPQLLTLTDELADPFSQALNVGDIHHQQGRSGRLSIACGNAEESPARCDLIAHGTAVDESGAVEDTDNVSPASASFTARSRAPRRAGRSVRP